MSPSVSSGRGAVPVISCGQAAVSHGPCRRRQRSRRRSGVCLEGDRAAVSESDSGRGGCCSDAAKGRVEAGRVLAGQCLRPWGTSRLNVALKDSASTDRRLVDTSSSDANVDNASSTWQRRTLLSLFANLNSHESIMIVINAIALAKTAKVFDASTVCSGSTWCRLRTPRCSGSSSRRGGRRLQRRKHGNSGHKVGYSERGAANRRVTTGIVARRARFSLCRSLHR